MTIRVSGNVEKFRQMMEDDPGRFEATAQAAKAAGAIHHRFGFGDGYVLAIDEWNTAEAFEQFFQNPDIGAMMAEADAGKPEITIAEAIDSPDQF